VLIEIQTGDVFQGLLVDPRPPPVLRNLGDLHEDVEVVDHHAIFGSGPHPVKYWIDES
jgi:hypothetical protein